MATPIETIRALLSRVKQLEKHQAELQQQRGELAATLLQLQTGSHAEDSAASEQIGETRQSIANLDRLMGEAAPPLTTARAELESHATVDLMHHVAAEVRQIGGRIEEKVRAALLPYFESHTIAEAVAQTTFLEKFRMEQSKIKTKTSGKTTESYISLLLGALDNAAALEKSLP